MESIAEKDVAALARELRDELPGLPFGKREELAHIVLTSDWLAAYVERLTRDLPPGGRA